MAENKKSFIAYADWKGMFEALPDEIAGKLIKHVFAYVNDENPTTDNFIINALFEQIKSTLKRDLVKWESQREQRSLAGKISAERRLTKSNDRSTTVNETVRNPTVSVSVNDNVNESDNVKEKNISNSSFKNTLLKNENWKKSISSEFKISIEEVEIKLNVFEKHLFDEQKFHPSMNEFTKHFKYWFPVNKSKNGKSTTTTGIPTASFSKNR
jgi:hypothetical protein